VLSQGKHFWTVVDGCRGHTLCSIYHHIVAALQHYEKRNKIWGHLKGGFSPPLLHSPLQHPSDPLRRPAQRQQP
jgi:hypothetical protein